MTKKESEDYPVFFVGGETYDGKPIFKKFKGKNAYNRAEAYFLGLKHCTDSTLTKIIRDDTK